MGLLSALGKRGTRMLDRPWAQPLNAASPVGEALTNRQRQILELAGSGMDDMQIAQALRVEPSFVRMVMGRANGKLGARHDYRGWSDGMLPPGMF